MLSPRLDMDKVNTSEHTRIFRVHWIQAVAEKFRKYNHPVPTHASPIQNQEQIHQPHMYFYLNHNGHISYLHIEMYTQNNWGLKISMQTRAYTPEIIWGIGTSLKETIWKNQVFLWWYSKFSSKINILIYIYIYWGHTVGILVWLTKTYLYFFKKTGLHPFY